MLPDLSTTEGYMSQKAAFLITLVFIISIALSFIFSIAVILLGSAVSIILTDIQTALTWNKEFRTRKRAPVEPVKSALFSIPIFSILFNAFVYLTTPLSLFESLLSSFILLSLAAYSIFYIAVYQTTLSIEIGTDPLDEDDKINKIWFENEYINRLEAQALENQNE